MATQDPGAEQAVQEALAEIQQALAGAPSLEEFGLTILNAALRMVDGDAGSIMLLTQDGKALQVIAAVGPDVDQIMGSTQSLSTSFAARALISRSPLTIKGLDNRSAYPRDLLWSAVVPLIAGRRDLGVLNINCDRNAAVAEAFTIRLQRLAEHVAPMLAYVQRT